MFKSWSVSSQRWGLMIVLLTAVFLRLHDITTVPPGLTHDEADHGISAWGIVNGERPIYFSIGYGREPLYDYATAVLMAFLGPTYLAGRVTAVFFGLIVVAGMYAWTRLAFDPQTALYTAAGLAVGFWPVMTSRQMLRSVMLPALFVLAVWLFWLGLRDWEIERLGDWRLGIRKAISNLQSPISFFLLAGVFIGLTFYTYIPSRILWMVFLVWLAYMGWRNRPLFGRVGLGVGSMFLVAFLIGSPLFAYLYRHPEAEIRIGQLSQPLKTALQGDFDLLLQNSLGALRLFTVEGDSFWRYNIAGQSLLPLVLGVFFYVGVGTAVFHAFRPMAKQSAAFVFALLWLAAGFSPALITGPDLSTTQTIGMQPVMYLFVAMGCVEVCKWASGQAGKWASEQVGKSASEKRGARSEGRGTRSEDVLRPSPFALRPFTLHLQPSAAHPFILALFAITAVLTYRTYFNIWANHPEVRVQYETTMVEAMRYLNEHGVGSVAISTITPGPVHSPAVAQMTLRRDDLELRWFDGNHALLLPQNGRSTLLFPGFAALNPALQLYFESAVLQETLPLRETDLDRPITIYQLNGQTTLVELRQQFSVISDQYSVISEDGTRNTQDVLEFLGYDLQTLTPQPGETVQLATMWRVIRPLPEAKLFAQILQPNGVLAQDDRLDVPAYNWHPGDVFIQLHQFTLPPETAVGDYPLITGLYNPTTGERLPVLVNNQITADYLELTTLNVTP